MKRLVWFSFVVIYLNVLPSPAYAYLRTVTPKGKVLFWNDNNIPFHINRDVPAGLDANRVYATIRASFATWSTPTCTCLRFKDGGLTNSKVLGYDQKSPASNQNIILFQPKKWSPHPSQAVAITSNIFIEDTGQVVAYDMELNSQNFTFSLDGAPRNGKPTMDLQNVVTHEVGHVIGLDHSTVRASTMFTSGLPGETKKRDLHSDDIKALCLIYPVTNGCKETTEPPDNKTACGCQQSPSNTTPFNLMALVFLLCLGLRFFAFPKRSS